MEDAATFTLKDFNGRTYKAIEVAGERIETTSSSSTGQSSRLRLSDGRALTHHLDNDTYEIVETGEVLTRP